MPVTSPSVVVVGSVALDTIETPTERREDLLGGSVTYACAAASFFSRVGMVGVVGEDFHQDHIALYDSLGIDLTGLQRVPGRTFRWSGRYHEDMINRETLSTELNVFESFSPELPEAYRDVPFLLLGNISPELQLHVFSQARSPRFVLADTMDLWINERRAPLMDVIGRCTLLTLNDSEARLLTGEFQLPRAAARILGWGPEYVVIKKGEHGAILFSQNGAFIVPAFPLDALQDPTGAGDTFAGAFVGALAARPALAEADIRQALLCGSVVASFGVEAFSLERLASLTNGDIRERLARLQAMMRVEG